MAELAARSALAARKRPSAAGTALSLRSADELAQSAQRLGEAGSRFETDAATSSPSTIAMY
jgi:hypothetical protein